MSVLSNPARLGAAILSATGVASLAAQGLVSYGLTGGLGATLWVMAGYFTVLTNLLVTITFMAVALRARPFGASWHAGLTLWIAFVGVIYHLILARLWAPEGLAWWADQGLHSAVPGLALLWWLTFAPKARLRLRHATLWLIWPVLYLAYAMARGAATARYPYPFLDLGALGAGAVAVNAVGLTAAFLLAGLALVGIARVLAR